MASYTNHSTKPLDCTKRFTGILKKSTAVNVQVVLTRWGTDPGKPEGASSEVSMCKHVGKTELAVIAKTVQVQEVGDVDISLTELADVDGTLRTFRIVLNLGGNKQKKTESLNQRKGVNHFQHCVGLSVCVCALNMQFV